MSPKYNSLRSHLRLALLAVAGCVTPVTALGLDEGIPEAAPELRIESTSVSGTGTGARLRVVGSGFGNVPENLSALIEHDDGTVTMLRVLSASDTGIEAAGESFGGSGLSGRIAVRVGTGRRAGWGEAPGEPQRRPVRPIELLSRSEAGGRPESKSGARGEAEGGDVNSEGPLPVNPLDLEIRGPWSVWTGIGVQPARGSEIHFEGLGVSNGAKVIQGRLESGMLVLDWAWDESLAGPVGIGGFWEDETGAVAGQFVVHGIVLGGESAAAEKAVRVVDVLRAVCAQSGGTRPEASVDGATAEAAGVGSSRIQLRLSEHRVVRGALALWEEPAAVRLQSARVRRTVGTRFDRLTFQFETLAGRRYRIQSLVSGGPTGVWRDVGEFVGTGGIQDFEEAVGGQPMTIYRVVGE